MAAGDDQQQAHRPGAYKQKNKQHKHGKHRTKGDIGRENKGMCDEFIKKAHAGTVTWAIPVWLDTCLKTRDVINDSLY